MEEQEFRRLLELFPIARSRDYRADAAVSRESSSRAVRNELTEWQAAWGEMDKKEDLVHAIDMDEDPFWEKLKLAAERKVSKVDAEKFCKAFQRVHKKLVYETLSLDAAQMIVNTAASSNE